MLYKEENIYEIEKRENYSNFNVDYWYFYVNNDTNMADTG